MSGFQFDMNTPAAYIYAAPTDNRDYSVDWVNVIPTGDSIATATWNLPAGVSQGNGAFSVASTVTTGWLQTAGANPEGEYYVSITVDSTLGRQWTRGFRLIVAENQ